MPAKRSNPRTIHRAGELRRESTPAERKLWAYLRGDKLNGVSFRRQHAIGNFIPDFVSIKKKLIIELDGNQHLEQAEYDVERSRYFESQGYKVIRFWNNQVENDVNRVIQDIEFALNDRRVAPLPIITSVSRKGMISHKEDDVAVNGPLRETDSCTDICDHVRLLVFVL